MSIVLADASLAQKEAAEAACSRCSPIQSLVGTACQRCKRWCMCEISKRCANDGLKRAPPGQSRPNLAVASGAPSALPHCSWVINEYVELPAHPLVICPKLEVAGHVGKIARLAGAPQMHPQRQHSFIYQFVRLLLFLGSESTFLVRLVTLPASASHGSTILYAPRAI